MTVSQSRRHSAARALQRRWEDVYEWPFHFVILPVLVAFAFCLVLFLGSKHGTRLAAFRTWFPTSMPCRSAACIQAVTVDSEGGLVAGLSSVVPAASGALIGLLRLDTTREAQGSTLDDFGSMTLSTEDQLKYDFAYWLMEGDKLAGQQSKDCDANFGFQYVEKWRKARLDLCTPAAVDGVAAAAAQAPGRGTARRRLRGSSSNGGGDDSGSKTAAAAAVTTVSDGQGASASASAGDAAAASSASPGAEGNGSLPAGPYVPSSISLYPYHDKEAYLMFALSINTVLDSRSFLGSLPNEMPEARYGSYAAACHIGGKTSPPGEEFMNLESVRRWTKDALQAEEYGKVWQACAPKNVSGNNSSTHTGIVDHPVLLLSRLDSTSAFRTFEEIVSTFTLLAALRDPEILQKGLQVVLADGKPDGFYLDLWATLSRPYPLRLLAQHPWPANTCLTHAVHNMYGGSSILTSMGVAKKTTCKSSVVMAASLWLRHMLGPAVQPVLRSAFGAQRQNKGVVRKSVVWISRRNFEGLAQSNLTPWQDQRRFENEGEVVLELQREIWRWNDEACLRSGLTKSFSTSVSSISGHRRQLQLRRLKAVFHQDGAATAATDRTLGQHLGDEYSHLDKARDEHLDLDLDPDLDSDSDEAQWSAGSNDADTGIGVEREAEKEEEESLEGGTQRRFRRLHAGGGSRCRASNVFFDLRVVELNDIPFYPDHVQVVGQATVLVGAHGTGLANMIWMAPGRGGVLELHHNSAGNDHYHNQAHLLGHKYVHVDSDGDRVDLAAAAVGLRTLLDMLGSTA
ncbi:hypothetical protein Vretimale_13907 [Volvox reticuliferus]|uniref:Uncharacterized protein n=1 Tax=Volvox reticuliferus TaxID=1737510 RepID=A0A8J4GM89_9CHLO|nr:hypothetical protein Vretimale_13907 [Volvox reticuliferus]